MEVKAKARYIKMSPRKVRLVIDIIRGTDVINAGNQLQFFVKAAAKPVLKLLNSAVANAENNFNLKRENLYIKEIKVDEGPTLHRWQPRAFGRATPIRKRISHISIILDEKKAAEAMIKKSAKELGDLKKKTKNAKKEISEVITVKDLKDMQKKASSQEKGTKDNREEIIDRNAAKSKRGFFKKTFMRKTFG